MVDFKICPGPIHCEGCAGNAELTALRAERDGLKARNDILERSLHEVVERTGYNGCGDCGDCGQDDCDWCSRYVDDHPLPPIKDRPENPAPSAATDPTPLDAPLGHVQCDYCYRRGYVDGHRSTRSERDALQRFKDFVHRRLDTAGVPTHPDGPHSKEGCRIGDRLDLVVGERDAALARVGELNALQTRTEQANYEARVRVAELERLLKEIQESPHIAYPDDTGVSMASRQYAIGVADGHRCAAETARRAVRG